MTAARELHLTVPRQARYYTMGEVSGYQSIWILCHGYGQLAATFLRELEMFARPERLLVAPEALSRFYLDPIPHGPKARIGATWMTREDREREIEDHVRYLDLLHAELVRAAAPHVSTLALGFSQGTATVSRWLSLGETSVQQAILWAGSIPRDVDLVDAQRRGRVSRLDLAWGSRDTLVTPTYASTEIERLRSTGLQFRTHMYDGGHAIDSPLLETLAGMDG